MKYTIETSIRFKKDIKPIKKRGYDISLLKKVVEILSSGKPLPEQYKNHVLKGDYANYKECHIQPDRLLIYRIKNNILALILTRTGTYSDF
jgi:mRNA interferase YafQ